MAKRGAQLREHILWAAKDVFLDLGFERTSMDVVSNRAQTSKRSLYAHFESKEKLFLAVVDLVRGLLLDRLGMPEDHSVQPAEALAMFCGRYLEILLYESSIQMCRLSMAETTRFPEGASQYFDALFTEFQKRLSFYLKTTFQLSAARSEQTAERLIGQILYPRLPRALLGLDSLAKTLNPASLSPQFDLAPVRATVTDLLGSLATPGPA